MRAFFLALIAAVCLAAAWGYRGTVTAWLTPEPPPAPIVWDNGSVRSVEAEAASEPAQRITAQGVARKCVRRDEVIYADTACPKGFKEQAIKGGDRVTVLASGKPPEPAGKTEAAKRTGSLREVLDVEDQGELKRRITERAIEQSTK